MLKKLMVVWEWALALGLIAAIVLVACQYEHARREYQRECQGNVARIAALSGNKADGADQCQDPKQYMPWWYVLIAWPEGITTWALLATLGAIIWQAVETRKAAKATGDAARVAAKGVDATITAERAWIIGTLVNVPKWIPEADRLEIMYLAPLFKNYGRTPGRITRIRARVHYVAESESETLPLEPVYEAEKWYTFRFDGEIVLPSEGAVQPLRIGLQGITFRNVVAGKLRLYVYWQIDYRDVFGLCWYDRSCYEFHVPGGFDPMDEGFYVSGTAPKGYNRSPEKAVECP